MPNTYNIPPLNWLRSFEACARLGSFTAAAAELNITQPAVSHQVRLLEAHLKLGCCQTNRLKHQKPEERAFYEAIRERHSVRAASRFSLKVLRVDSDLCELK